MQNFTRPQLFTIYNRARAAANTGKLCPARVNRALGILQSADGAERLMGYQASITACGCPDAKHGHTCKHRIARMILSRISQ